MLKGNSEDTETEVIREKKFFCICNGFGSQRVGHNWATELNWMDLESLFIVKPNSILYAGGFITSVTFF